MPTDRVHRLPQQAQPRTLPPHRPQPAASDAATRPRHAHPGSEREALHPLRRAAPDPSRCTRYVALHPLRRNAPDQKRCNAYGSGAPPPTTSPTAGNSPPKTPTVHLGRCDTASTCSPGSEREALHPLRRAAPVTSRYTRYVATHPNRRGVMPTDRVHRLPQQAQPRTFPPDTPKRQHQTQPHNLEIPARLLTRGATPDPSRYTRYVAMHPIRRGVMPTDRV